MRHSNDRKNEPTYNKELHNENELLLTADTWTACRLTWELVMCSEFWECTKK